MDSFLRCLTLVILVVGCWMACMGAEPAANEKFPQKLEASGLHNLYRLNSQLYSGSNPEGDEGFASLKKLGVKTIISVDGAQPDVMRAHQFGLRYVHVPIGYDEVPREAMVKIAKAAMTLPGPIYVHCHHGKHRGPAAAVGLQLCTDKKCNVAEAVATMKLAGTDPHYVGLYDSVKNFKAPTANELARVKEFAEAVKVPALTELMTNVDTQWEVLAPYLMGKPVAEEKKPGHAAVLLWEQFQEAARLPPGGKDAAEFSKDLKTAVEQSEQLVKLLERKPAAPIGEISKQMQALKKTCTKCHDRDRDL